MGRAAPEISIVLPAHNEAGNIAPMAAAIAQVMALIGPYEIIFVDDGSSDGTLAALRARVTPERWLTVDLDRADAEISDPDAAVIRRDGGRVCLAFDPRVVAPAELIRRVTSQCAVRDLFVENPPIEAVIARLYKDGDGAGAAGGDAGPGRPAR